MGCCRETFACCKLRCKLADLGQCLADRFRDPQRLSAYAAHIFCTLYRPLRRIENDSGAESWSWRLSPSRAGARLTAAAGKSCGFVVATDLRRGPGTPRQCSFPITREGDRSRRFLPLRYEPVPRGARNFEQIQRHSPRDMSLRLGPVLPRRECAAGNTGKKSCYIPKK